MRIASGTVARLAFVAFSLGYAASIVPIASATPLRDVQHSDRVAHARVCEGPDRPGFARCHAHVVTDEHGEPIEERRGDIEARTATATAVTVPKGFGPADLASAYKFPADAGSQAFTIAIVDAYGYPGAEADLAVYRAQYGLPPCTIASGCLAVYNQSGTKTGYPAPNVGWEQETGLDLDMVSAACPGCRIIVVEANSAASTDLAAAANTAASLGANVISNSYGADESGTQSLETLYTHAGVAVVASTGDSGYGVQFPASSSNVTAIGGTHLTHNSNTRGWAETAWKGAGSGCSAIYAKPSWQADTQCTRRSEADVSAVADPGTPVAVYVPSKKGGSTWQRFGGTSVAAPLIAGIYGANGGTVVPGSPYANLGALFDVTTGSNGTCAITYLCHAGKGYDGPTGLGTPNGTTAF